MFNFWWLASLVNGLETCLPPLSSQKNKMLVLDYIELLMIAWAGQWTLIPVHHLSPVKKIKCLFLDYI